MHPLNEKIKYIDFRKEEILHKVESFTIRSRIEYFCRHSFGDSSIYLTSLDKIKRRVRGQS